MAKSAFHLAMLSVRCAIAAALYLFTSVRRRIAPKAYPYEGALSARQATRPKLFMKSSQSLSRRFHPANLVSIALFASCLSALVNLGPIPTDLKPSVIVSTTAEPITPGKFQPTWQSLCRLDCRCWWSDLIVPYWSTQGFGSMNQSLHSRSLRCACFHKSA
jgi:hypothetical protein